jgi:hypothetical protein
MNDAPLGSGTIEADLHATLRLSPRLRRGATLLAHTAGRADVLHDACEPLAVRSSHAACRQALLAVREGCRRAEAFVTRHAVMAVKEGCAAAA